MRYSSAAETSVYNSELSPLTEVASPPRASKSSACFVFFDPSFIPVPLNAGLRVVTGVVEATIRADEADASGASNRETGE